MTLIAETHSKTTLISKLWLDKKKLRKVFSVYYDIDLSVIFESVCKFELTHYFHNMIVLIFFETRNNFSIKQFVV